MKIDRFFMLIALSLLFAFCGTKNRQATSQTEVVVADSGAPLAIIGDDTFEVDYPYIIDEEGWKVRLFTVLKEMHSTLNRIGSYT